MCVLFYCQEAASSDGGCLGWFVGFAVVRMFTKTKDIVASEVHIIYIEGRWEISKNKIKTIKVTAVYVFAHTRCTRRVEIVGCSSNR